MVPALLLWLALAQAQSPPAAGLQIVVIDGENAVNIIQQRTAVAPIVEIRDRNGLPVAGAVVTFSVQGNLATFPGAVSTFTAVTNTAGQAVAAAVQPMAAGSFSIQVNAVFQGQSAVVAIAQSNVVTAAQAAAVGGSGGAATGGAATSGAGGLSGTTLGVVGAAVGGGVLAASQLAGGSEATPAAPAAPGTSRTLTSPIDFIHVHQISFPNAPSCTIDHRISGTMTLELTLTGESATGTLRYTGTDAQVAATCAVRQFVSGGWGGSGTPGTVTGTRGALSARIETRTTNPSADVPAGATQVVHTLLVFEGAFDGTTVTGTFAWEWSSDISGTATQTTRSRTVVPVTLR
jgi:hypothetical protein